MKTWKILRALSDVFKKTIDINSFQILRENLFKDYPIFKEIDELPKLSIDSLTFKNITPVNGTVKIADFDFTSLTLSLLHQRQ